MSRIADKHGLTNKYRQAGMGKRVVRRGRSRKYLFGSPRRRSNNIYVDETVAKYTGVGIGVFVIILIILMLLSINETFSIISGVFFVICPLIGFPFLFFYIDKKLKIHWKLPNNKGSMPASGGWFALTMLEMGICFFMNLFVVLGILRGYVVLITVVIYILWSIYILTRKNKKIDI